MKVIAVIPARYASTRLPAKPLADIHGKPMIQHVYERAKKANTTHQTVIATDDERIAQAARKFGATVAMTSPDINSGTERVAAVADEIPGDVYVNIQGDEPLIEPKAIDEAVKLVTQYGFPMGTVMTLLKTEQELDDPSVVKVIADKRRRAIYFSRLPIPYSRGPRPQSKQPFACMRHVGLYVYTRQTLQEFRKLPPTPLEQAEVLEQLRALDAGIPIGITHVEFTSVGVDTPDDLERVRKILGS
jgi:3-deoxy-manno-octulosonate cytidylyltransferase (CMP-KDO synthetase)